MPSPREGRGVAAGWPLFYELLACGSVEGRDGQVEESDTDTDS
ncbi:hypothetical protein [Ktedonobacter robiniae]|nr:hypothetical protein [Ktedonobacter robiniae]